MLPKKLSKKIIKRLENKKLTTADKGNMASASKTDYGGSTNSRLGTRPGTGQAYSGKAPTDSNTTKITEMTCVDDPEKRFLRRTDYQDMQTEIKDLALTKEEQMHTLKNMIKVS